MGANNSFQIVWKNKQTGFDKNVLTQSSLFLFS